MPTIIYGLHNANGNVRYIGKTKRALADRLRGHRSARNGPLPLHRWLAKNHGHVEAVVLEIVPDDGDWRTAERAWIAAARAAGIGLLNVADGGEGWAGAAFSDAHRARIAAAKRRGAFRPCEQCGVLSWAAPSSRRRFCSRACKDAWHRTLTFPGMTFPQAAIDAAAAKRRAIAECPAGHPYAGDNLAERDGRRVCKECRRLATARYRARKLLTAPSTECR